MLATRTLATKCRVQPYPKNDSILAKNGALTVATFHRFMRALECAGEVLPANKTALSRELRATREQLARPVDLLCDALNGLRPGHNFVDEVIQILVHVQEHNRPDALAVLWFAISSGRIGDVDDARLDTRATPQTGIGFPSKQIHILHPDVGVCLLGNMSYIESDDLVIAFMAKYLERQATFWTRSPKHWCKTKKTPYGIKQLDVSDVLRLDPRLREPVLRAHLIKARSEQVYYPSEGKLCDEWFLRNLPLAVPRRSKVFRLHQEFTWTQDNHYLLAHVSPMLTGYITWLTKAWSVGLLFPSAPLPYEILAVIIQHLCTASFLLQGIRDPMHGYLVGTEWRVLDDKSRVVPASK